ncbi:NACHT domain-containing protein [Streptomyces sp. NPDC050264]|uniref:NACHT domain-containing protein n=1 Tax=Streptomyces sp. NPDC050264 TaxID=3155038 RepID=UPI00344A5F69
MVDPGTVGVRVASSAVTPLVRRLFVPPGPGAALTERPVRLSALVTFRGEQRTLGARELRRLVRELVRRTEQRLVPDESDAVADALELTLYALGDLDLDDVQAVDLGHAELAARLHEQAGGDRLVRLLSQDATALYNRLLDSACVNILHFFTQRSPFVARTLVEQSRRLRELIDRTDILIERLGSQSADDAGFEARYASHIARKHSSLTIYGIDLDQSRQWPLDTAYLSLQAAHQPERTLTGTPWEEERWTQPLSQPVEQALSGHARVLLRGVAGSGKTTLVQWLAVATARQSRLSGELAHLIGRVPFVLPLRTLTRKGAALPPPADFLRAVGSPLTGAQPSRWADRVLAAGRALLLIDGIDEIPEGERPRARAWLTDLLSAYPDNLCLVTSRPSAVRNDWLGSEDFTDLTLAPMRRENTAVFVARWHEAAGADPALGAALLDALRTKQDLGALATNPLMCALICALHRERRGFLPRGRKALYDAALSMLLERRDRERDMAGAGLDLDEESQTELLQKLAYWLIRNGRSEMDRDDAVGQLARLLPAMPHVAGQGGADTVLRHLLVRSGLLREPAAGSIEFIHRTFQDYLGARAAVEERDFDLLVRHAHLDQWEDVLRMAVAQARPDERARLLRGLTERGDAEPQRRKRLRLLAMACLEHATKLDPQVREKVEKRAAELIPPHNSRESQALAELGPIGLGLLPGPAELDEPEHGQYVVQAAGLIGGEAALPTLVKYRDSELPGVGFQLGQFWGKFDTKMYADTVIAHLRDKPRVSVTAHNEAQLTALRRLGGYTDLDCVGDFSADCLEEHLTALPVRRLRMASNETLDDLEFLARIPGLRDLTLYRCRGVASLEPLRGLPLEHLFIGEAPLLDDLGPLRTLTALAYLNLRSVPGALDLTDISRDAPLTTLFPPTNVLGLAPLLDFPRLELVGLDIDSLLLPEDWDVLARLRNLAYVMLSRFELASMASQGVVLDQVTTLHLIGHQGAVDTGAVPLTFPALRTLTVTGAAEIDLAPLAECRRLETLYVTDAGAVRSAEDLPSRIRLVLTPRPAWQA